MWPELQNIPQINNFGKGNYKAIADSTRQGKPEPVNCSGQSVYLFQNWRTNPRFTNLTQFSCGHHKIIDIRGAVWVTATAAAAAAAGFQASN